MIPGVLAANPLERLLSQPQLLVLFAAGVVWILKLVGKASRSAARKAGPEAETRRREAEESEAVARRGLEDDERARRVREEILRKIVERRAQANRVPVEPPPLELPKATVIPVSVDEPVPALPAAPPQVIPRAASLPAAPLSPHATLPVSPWLEELRTREAARRAILLREILGPPVALR